MQKHILTILLLTTSIASVYAVPARKGWMTLTQPDSTTIEARLVGDEHFHYYENRDGQKIRQNDAGFWVVITNAEFDRNRKAQRTRISVTVPGKMHVGETFAPHITTNSNGSMSFYTSDEGIVSVDPILGTITAQQEGRVYVIIEVSPTRTHYSATRTVNIKVVP